MVFKTPKYTKGNQMNPEQLDWESTDKNSIFWFRHSSTLLQSPWHHYPNNMPCVYKIGIKLLKKKGGLVEESRYVSDLHVTLPYQIFFPYLIRKKTIKATITEAIKKVFPRQSTQSGKNRLFFFLPGHFFLSLIIVTSNSIIFWTSVFMTKTDHQIT